MPCAAHGEPILKSLHQRAKATLFGQCPANLGKDHVIRTPFPVQPGGTPDLVDSTSPQLGEKATYDSAVCLETGKTSSMSVQTNCTAATWVAFLEQLRAQHKEPLIAIWDNAPTHRGEALRTLPLQTCRPRC